MDDPSKGRMKIRRKLSKQQIIEILERNVALYKDDDAFVHYLVDLAVYLMEYEYDWGESNLPIPEAIRTRSEAAAAVRDPGGAGPPPQAAVAKNSKICPFCGTSVGDVLICPSCRNLTR
jgi:hypothetical protein